MPTRRLTKTCPRCTGLLPAQAAFCGACGWSFSAPAEPALAPVASGGQPVAPALAPVQSQQLGMPGTPQSGPLGAPGFQHGISTSMPRKRLSTTLLAAMVLAAVLTLAVPGFFIVNGLNGHGLNPLVDQHGLPSDVPLPSGATFQAEIDQSNSTGTLKTWYWTIENPNTHLLSRGSTRATLSAMAGPM